MGHAHLHVASRVASKPMLRFVTAAALLIAAAGTTAAEGCPPDRPYERVVVDTTATMTCSLALCIELVCPPDNAASEPCYHRRCPQACSPIPWSRVCLSKEELDAAIRRR